jgi:hypothetical protein
MRRNPVAAFVAVVGLCLLFSGLAQAATVTVSWTNPTTNTDGSALPASAITRTTIVYGTTSAMTSNKVVTGSATSTTLDLAPGTWYVAAKSTANGNDSNLSAVVTYVVAQPTPNPPTGLSVVAVVAGLNMAPAYKILADGSRSTVVAGFVKVGTACSGPVVFTYRNKGYRAVPNKAVSWWSPTLADVRSPPPVAAPCA